jgi:hypothetical protein
MISLAALGVVGIAGAQATPDISQANALNGKRTPSFTKNNGQWNASALFHGRSAGMDFWITNEGLKFQFARTAQDKASKYEGQTVGMIFEGANKFSAQGIDESGTRQYVLNKKTVTSDQFTKVNLSNVYTGIDVVAYHTGKTPRYDFIVKPGAKTSAIKLAFKGASSINVIGGTKLEMGTVLGARYQEGLFAYQNVNGKKKPVEVSFKKLDATHVGFEVGAYDTTKELVIDPLVYGTYYGGDAGWDEVRGVAADARGNVYMTGYTRATNYPVLYGPFGFNLRGGRDAFVSRLQGDAYAHDYSALLAGTGDDQGNFINVDSFGNVWVVGSTTSTNFPGSGAGNTWIMRFKPSTATILDPFIAGAPQVFQFGGTVVTGITSFSTQFVSDPVAGSPVRLLLTGSVNSGVSIPTPAGSPLGAAGNQGAFYLTLNYSEPTGPAGNSAGFSVQNNSTGYVNFAAPATGVTLTGSAFDSAGNFFLNGSLLATGNSDTAQGTPAFATTGGVFQNGRLQRGNDIWVRKYSPLGAVAWSGLLGGGSSDFTEGFTFTHARTNDVSGTTIAADPQGNAYIVGRSNSFEYPRTRGVFGEAFNSGTNYIVVTKVSADGTQVLYSTNLRNNGPLLTSGIAVDPRGNAYLTGTAFTRVSLVGTPPDPIEPNQVNNPLSNIPSKDAIRAAYTGPALPEATTNDGWFIILNSDATDIIRSTYIGGFLDEGVFAPYVDRGGDVWVYGWVDTHRYYSVINSTLTTVTERAGPGGTFGGLDPAFITALAFKQAPEPPGAGALLDKSMYFFEGSPAPPVLFSDVYPAPNRPVRYTRDGFLLRFRESLPLVNALTLNPNSIPGGDPSGVGTPASSTATVTLSGPAPVGGATINLSLDNGTAASFAANAATTTSSIIIPAGSTTGTFSVFGRSVLDVSNVQVRADYSGNVKVGALQVVPWLTSFTLNSNAVIGGNVVSTVVRLAAPAPAGGAVVTLSTNRTDLVTFPAGPTVTVPAGATTAVVQVATEGVVSAVNVQVGASLLGVTRNQTLTINPARLKQIVVNPDTVAGGNSTKAKVVLDGKAAEAFNLNLSIQGNPAGYSVSPTSITIPAGATESAEFTVNAGFELATRTRIVQAVRVNSSNTVIDGPVTGIFTVQSIIISTFTIAPPTIESGGTAVGTLTLSADAPAGGVSILISSSLPGVAQPVNAAGNAISSVVVPAGSRTATFNIKGLLALAGDTLTTMSAYLGPTPFDGAFQKQASLTVKALTYSMVIAPSDVFGGETAVGTITLSAPATAGFAMTVTNPDSSVTFTQPVFAVGSRTATFNISTSLVTDTKSVTFSTRAGTLPVVTAPLTIRAPEVTSVRVLPSNRVRQGSTVTIEVRLNRAVVNATAGKITLSNASLLELPAGATDISFTVQPGSSLARLTFRTRRVPRNLSTTLTATISPAANGASASATLFVIR